MLIKRAIIASLAIHLAVGVGLYAANRPVDRTIASVAWVEFAESDRQAPEESVAGEEEQEVVPVEEVSAEQAATEEKKEIADKQSGTDRKDAPAVAAMDDFTRAALVQDMIARASRYSRSTTLAIRAAASGLLDDSTHIDSSINGTIAFSFDDGGLTKVSIVDGDIDKLAKITSNIDWSPVQSPRSHQLPFNKVMVNFTLQNNKINLSSLRFG